jgi:cytosine/adenosine deaminase-related metal-dependent hydrolase
MRPTTNAHTHLELTDLAHLCPDTPQPFFKWLRLLVWALLWRRRKSIPASIRRGIDELSASGATHIGDVTATWQSVGPLLGSGLCGVVYLEVAGWHRERALIRLEQAKDRIVQARAEAGDSTMQVGLSLHAPYSCHPDLLREGAAWCREQDIPLCVHVSESPAELEWMQCGTLSTASRQDALLASLLGLRAHRSPGQRPVSYMASLGVLDARPLLVHAIHVTDDEIAQIAASGCSVAHCPRSNSRLSCGRLPLERYLAAGVRVYLGTDSRASSPSLDIHDEAAFALELHASRIAPEQIQQLLHRTL